MRSTKMHGADFSVDAPSLIKPSRTITFTTNEASYIDVDISPDSKTLLFSFLGEIFSMPADGGIAKQLTKGLAINRCPVWSPNGKLIAYESDATGFIRLHVADIAAKFHKMLDEDETQNENIKPIWFPDSKNILVKSKAYNITGITSATPPDMERLLGFSGDGKYMYYLTESSPNNHSIIKYERLSGIKKELLRIDTPNFYFSNAKITPDGRWFTYIKQKSVYSIDSLMSVDLTNGNEKLLANLNTPFAADMGDYYYSLTTDSKYLFIGYGGKIHRIDIESGENRIIPFTARVDIELGSFDYKKFNVSLDSFKVGYIRSAQKSRDGKHLVFCALNKIYIMDLPKGKPRLLVDQNINQFEPVYSPDGQWIAYVSWSDNEGGQMWRVSAKGNKPEQITSVPGLYIHPSWSPDGKMIVVAKGNNELGRRDDPGNGAIEIINLESKEAKVYAEDVPLFNQPEFSNDGSCILFKPSQEGGSNQMWPRLISLDVKTKIDHPIAIAQKDEIIPLIRQIKLSPDSRYIVYLYNEDIYLAPTANIGSPEIIIDEKTPTILIRFARGAIDPVWGNGGKTLSWVSTNKFYSVNPDKIIGAASQLEPNRTLEGLPQTKIIDVDIPADETITIPLKVASLSGSGIIALKNARVITMHRNDIIENGTVIIKNGRLVKLGDTKKVNIPQEATVIDLEGKTIIPGLIDMHSHMYEAVPPDVFLQQSWQRLLEFSYGVTTMRDPSGSFDTFGYSELVETGQAIGPRLFTVGRAVRPEFYDLNSLHEAKTIVDDRVKYRATYIKQYLQPTRLQRQLLLQACKEAGVNMTNEVEKNPLYAIGMFKDGSTGIEHNPVWGEIYNDVIKLVAKSGTYLCPTLQACYGREEGKYYFRKLFGQEFLNRSTRFMSDDYKKDLLLSINSQKLDSGFLDQSRIDARIKHAGGKIVMGSHGEDQGIGAHWEIWALQMGGLTNHEALETATITAAEALGMQKDLGSIEVGKIADLIIFDKNPLEDIHNTTSIKYVMKAGVLYDSETLDEVWPEKKKGPTVWR